MQSILFIEICFAIAVSSLDFQPKEADSLVGDDKFEHLNQTEIRPDSVSEFTSVIPLNKTRQQRIHVFRPLFVYRQEQLMKQQIQNNKNPDRNTVNKKPKPTAPAPAPVYPGQGQYVYYNYTPAYYPYPPAPVAPVGVPFYPYAPYPSSHPYVNTLPPSYHYPSYQYPAYSSYPSSSYSSYYSSRPTTTYYPSSYYTGWPSTVTGHSNYDYYTSKGYLSNGATNNEWPTSASFYAPQAAAVSYTYPTVWQRK